MIHEGRSCLTNSVSFYDKVSHLVNQGKPLRVNRFWFSAKLLVLFLTVSHKMPGVQLGSHMMLRVSGWLMGWAQRVIVNGITSGWQPVTSKVLKGSILGQVIANNCGCNSGQLFTQKM